MNRNRKRITERILFLLLVLLLLVCSYLRYTYVINPNFSGEPLLISIQQSGGTVKNTLDLNDQSDRNINQFVKGKSILVFWVFFGLLDYFLMRSWRGKQQDTALFLVSYGGLTLISIAFLVLHYLFRPDQVFFTLFSEIKNFLLTPLFTGLIFIIARIYER